MRGLSPIDVHSPRPVYWVGSSRQDMKRFPTRIRRAFGHGLWLAQNGDLYVGAKPLKGFGGAGVIELVERFDGNAYRAVYTIRMAGAVYVLHAFEKKSKRGVKTPPRDMNVIRNRLRKAEEHYAKWKQQDQAK